MQYYRVGIYMVEANIACGFVAVFSYMLSGGHIEFSTNPTTGLFGFLDGKYEKC